MVRLYYAGHFTLLTMLVVGAYDPDASFVICVVNGNGPEDEENGSQFKTKNKHMIRKVLWTACRTFACQDDYDRCMSAFLYISSMC